AAHREATRLAALLTLHFQEEAGLRRLQERLRSEARRSRGAARILPMVHRWMAAAAMLLVAIGPFLWLALTAGHGPDEGLPGLSIAWENRTQWQQRDGRKELTSGDLLAQRDVSTRSKVAPGVVNTSAGTVSAADAEAEFFVEVQP